MDSTTEKTQEDAGSSDTEKSASGHPPAAEGTDAPSSADNDLPKLLIVKRKETESPGPDTGGSPWRRSPMQTTTIRTTALVPKPLMDVETPLPVPKAKPALRLQQKPPPEPPADTRGTAKGPPKRRSRVVPNLLLTHIAAAALTIALITLATATVFLTLYKELTPAPLWHSLLAWFVVGLFTFIIASNVKACQFFSVVITLLAILVVGVIMALEFMSLGPAPEMLNPWLPPWWRAVSVLMLGVASVTIVSGQTWLRYGVAVLLAAGAFWLLSSYDAPPAAVSGTAVRAPPAITSTPRPYALSQLRLAVQQRQ